MPAVASTGQPPIVTTPSLIRSTYVLVGGALRSSRPLLIALAVISILLGVVPTLKSELESGVISAVSEHLTTPSPAWHTFLSPLPRFSDHATRGWPERLARFVFGGLPLLAAFGLYVVIGLVGLGLEVGAAKATSGIGKEVFRRLRSAGFRRGLEADPGTLQSIPNAPGQYAVAIHQGATTHRTPTSTRSRRPSKPYRLSP